MVAYNFHPQFVPSIRSGLKDHTIRKARAGKSRHAKAGEALQLYTGSRFKPRKIGEAVCIAPKAITLDFEEDRVELEITGGLVVGATLFIDGAAALDEFARTDGFHEWAQMRAFWQLNHGLGPGNWLWEGVAIYWKDFKSHDL